MSDARIFLVGGTRSGKSELAERLVADEPSVTYLASSYPVTGEDAAWQERVEAHRKRRPLKWRTVESLDVAGVLAACEGACLWDSVGTWVSAVLDELDAWSTTRDAWGPAFENRVNGVVTALHAAPHPVVAVSSEVGLSLVATTSAGRLYADVLGETNQAIAAACGRAYLVVAGRTLALDKAEVSLRG